MCDFIFMIYQGRKVLDGTLESIQDTYGTDTVRVRIDAPASALEDLPGVLKVSDFGNFQELRLGQDADRQRLLAALITKGPVQSFELARPSLHDVFVRIARPNGQESADA
jgi:ABC-2 type transport system ATP-binding protein